jgi:hypothetical protein
MTSQSHEAGIYAILVSTLLVRRFHGIVHCGRDIRRPLNSAVCHLLEAEELSTPLPIVCRIQYHSSTAACEILGFVLVSLHGLLGVKNLACASWKPGALAAEKRAWVLGDGMSVETRTLHESDEHHLTMRQTHPIPP